MRSLAAVIAAAVLGSGCIITSDDGQGTVNLYWDFVRYAPAAPTADVDGRVYYDTGLTGTGTGLCQQSGVEEVRVTIQGQTTAIDCLYYGVQGIAVDGVDAGDQLVTISGWRTIGADWIKAYESTATVNVRGGGEVSYTIDVEPVIAPADLFVTFWYVDGTAQRYPSCTAAQDPIVEFELRDSYGTLVDTYDAVACNAADGVVALTLDPALAGTLDLDTYYLRARGYTLVGGVETRTFDTCASAVLTDYAFDHVAPATGLGGYSIPLSSPPACP
jgi:hypothetical protein